MSLGTPALLRATAAPVPCFPACTAKLLAIDRKPLIVVYKIAFAHDITPAQDITPSFARDIRLRVRSFPAPPRGCVARSLRRSKATEAISDVLEKLEIAALPSVARNDENPIMTRSLTTEGQGEGGLGEAWRSTLHHTVIASRALRGVAIPITQETSSRAEPCAAWRSTLFLMPSPLPS